MINLVIETGRLTATPELKTTTNGISVCSFTIAVDRSFKSGEERQTDFINCVAWRSTAEFISKFFTKGKLIGIEGSLQSRRYQDKNGDNRTAFEVVVDKAHFIGAKNDNKADEDKLPEFENKLETAQKSSGTDIDNALDDDGDLPFL